MGNAMTFLGALAKSIVFQNSRAIQQKFVPVIMLQYTPSPFHTRLLF